MGANQCGCREYPTLPDNSGTAHSAPTMPLFVTIDGHDKHYVEVPRDGTAQDVIFATTREEGGTLYSISHGGAALELGGSLADQGVCPEATLEISTLANSKLSDINANNFQKYRDALNLGDRLRISEFQISNLDAEMNPDGPYKVIEISRFNIQMLGRGQDGNEYGIKISQVEVILSIEPLGGFFVDDGKMERARRR